MKTLYRPLFATVLVGLLAAVSPGCDGGVDPGEDLSPLVAPLDSDAGTWQMLVLAAPDQIAVAAPTAVESAAYVAELATLAANQSAMTDAQREQLAYWSGGGVLRWNQRMLELAARFNLPPAPRPNGSYPVPDPENPFADPTFPFANPPYSSRAFSYVAVAQYEALKAAWHWKHVYNRPAPSRVAGSGVQALVPVSELPAYPSEDAVLAGVTSEMLKLLFPAAVADITRWAGEQRAAALLSGRATASDVAAGLALGRAVAAVVVARARTDGAGQAGGAPGAWEVYADSAEAHGELPWASQDVPARPPLLPFFGNVLTWTMTRDELIAARPGPPPSTSSAAMQAELEEVYEVSEDLTPEQRRIAFFWNDGAGTYTPPGHWNDIASDYIGAASMSEVRAARTFAFLNMAMHDAAVACWDAKFLYFNPRPFQLDPRIRTTIGLPNFPAYPSGHSTYSAAAATTLAHFFPSEAATFQTLADEAGISRLYGAIHYRADIEGGRAHGIRVGGHAVELATQDGAE